MTGYSRVYGRSRTPRRYVPWSEKVFYLEQSKRKVQVEAKLERHTELFFRGAFAEFQKRILEMVCCSTASDEPPWELQPRAVGGVVNRVQLDVQAAIPESEAPPPTVGEQLPRRVSIRRSVELARYGYTDRCIGCQRARLGLKPADHTEECRARIVRNMTADDNLNQRLRKTELLKLHLLKQELVNEILYQSRQERRSDSRSELKNKHLRYSWYTFTECQQHFEQSKQQSNRDCTIDAG